MKTLGFLLLMVSLLAREVPYKAEDEYAVTFELSFKRYEQGDANTVRLQETVKEHELRNDPSPLPYLTVKLEVLKVMPGDFKLKVLNPDSSTFKKRVEAGLKIPIIADYVYNLEDQVSGNRYTILFMNREGSPVSKVVIDFDRDGFYSVNGKKKGKL